MPYFLLNNQKINIENYNDDFLLLKRDQNDNLRDEYSLTKIGQVIYKSDITFIDEVIATDTEICLKLNNSFKEKDIQKLANLNYKSELNKISQNSKTFLMPVCFEEKDDWNTVEKQTNKTKKEIIESIVNLNFDLAMFGFLPGFVYLNGLPPKLYCARKSNPSKYVKPNSLAIG
ncbi:MAG: carboxyltransferase domain-containing protein, partial [Saprospiraceae bacterium]|nr:carboxyltransferase domain-containing protein [Saprospiraceae bacterium]